MVDSTKQKKNTSTPKPKKDSSPTLRQQWNKSGGSADITKTTKLLNTICDKLELY